MNWININITSLQSIEFISSDPIGRSTWLSLLGWCCQQENGGVIKNSKNWPDRMWQQLCGVTQEEVNNDSQLYFWKGNDLHIFDYPLAQEAGVIAKREAGKKGGRPKKNKEKKT